MTSAKKEEGYLPVISPLLKFFKWISLGIIVTFEFLITTTGDIFKLSFHGFKYLFIELPTDIYLGVSGGVDKTYKQAKYTVQETADEIEKAKQLREQKRMNSKSYLAKMAELEKMRQNLLVELNSEEIKRVDKATVYKYIAKNSNGKIIEGVFTGFSKLDVNAYLINEGFEVYHIETNDWLQFLYRDTSLMTKKLTNKDLIFWLTQLSTYIKSGIPLTDAVRIISNQMGSQNNGQKRIYDAIVYELTMGESFSKSLEKQGNIFPALLINMLKAAEATGELAETLDDMADYYNEMEKTRKQVLSAMTYPSIVAVFSIAVITFIMLYVIPQFTEIYSSVGASINGLTLSIINISIFLQENIITIFTVLIIASFIVGFAYKRLKAFRKGMQNILMRMPIIGEIMVYKEMSVITKTFASLLTNNVFITESMDILSKITNNEVYKEILFKTINNLAKGEKISIAFKDHWAIPEVAYHMIVTGESTGQLGSMMDKVAAYFQELNKNKINTLKAFIEPIMIASLAIIVGVIILAVIIPMFDLYSTIQM